jgi:hypothetical protein
LPLHVFGSLLEAFAGGRSARWLPGEDIEAMLTEDISMLRERLNIPKPVRYFALLERLKRLLNLQGSLVFAADDGSAL